MEEEEEEPAWAEGLVRKLWPNALPTAAQARQQAERQRHRLKGVPRDALHDGGRGLDKSLEELECGVRLLEERETASALAAMRARTASAGGAAGFPAAAVPAQRGSAPTSQVAPSANKRGTPEGPGATEPEAHKARRTAAGPSGASPSLQATRAGGKRGAAEALGAAEAKAHKAQRTAAAATPSVAVQPASAGPAPRSPVEEDSEDEEWSHLAFEELMSSGGDEEAEPEWQVEPEARGTSRFLLDDDQSFPSYSRIEGPLRRGNRHIAVVPAGEHEAAAAAGGGAALVRQFCKNTQHCQPAPDFDCHAPVLSAGRRYSQASEHAVRAAARDGDPLALVAVDLQQHMLASAGFHAVPPGLKGSELIANDWSGGGQCSPHRHKSGGLARHVNSAYFREMARRQVRLHVTLVFSGGGRNITMVDTGTAPGAATPVGRASATWQLPWGICIHIMTPDGVGGRDLEGGGHLLHGVTRPGEVIPHDAASALFEVLLDMLVDADGRADGQELARAAQCVAAWVQQQQRDGRFLAPGHLPDELPQAPPVAHVAVAGSSGGGGSGGALQVWERADGSFPRVLHPVGLRALVDCRVFYVARSETMRAMRCRALLLAAFNESLESPAPGDPLAMLLTPEAHEAAVARLLELTPEQRSKVVAAAAAAPKLIREDHQLLREVPRATAEQIQALIKAGHPEPLYGSPNGATLALMLTAAVALRSDLPLEGYAAAYAKTAESELAAAVEVLRRLEAPPKRCFLDGVPVEGGPLADELERLHAEAADAEGPLHRWVERLHVRLGSAPDDGERRHRAYRVATEALQAGAAEAPLTRLALQQLWTRVSQARATAASAVLPRSAAQLEASLANLKAGSKVLVWVDPATWQRVEPGTPGATQMTGPQIGSARGICADPSAAAALRADADQEGQADEVRAGGGSAALAAVVALIRPSTATSLWDKAAKRAQPGRAKMWGSSASNFVRRWRQPLRNGKAEDDGKGLLFQELLRLIKAGEIVQLMEVTVIKLDYYMDIVSAYLRGEHPPVAREKPSRKKQPQLVSTTDRRFKAITNKLANLVGLMMAPLDSSGWPGGWAR